MNEDNEHHHDHGRNHERHNADLNPEQLGRLIPYLKKHNLDHIGYLKKWRAQSAQSGFNDISEEFARIVELSEKIDLHFASALEMIKKRR
jgi:hypothetical protein